MNRPAALVACVLAVAGCSYDGSRLSAPARNDAAPEVVAARDDVLVAPPDVLATQPDTADAASADVADVASDLAADQATEDLPVVPDVPASPDLPANDDTSDDAQVTGAGGVGGTGGTVATGGAGGMGGVGVTGGSSGTGGGGGSGGTSMDARPDVSSDVSSDVPPDTAPSTVVTFVDGKAQGAFWGATFASLGLRDTLTSPTCNGFPIPGQAPAGDPALALASECPPEETIWSSADGLCMSGSIPAWPLNPTDADYDNNWGVLVGVDTRAPRQGMGVSYRNIKLTATGTPTTGLRAVIHLSPDPLNITYCAKVTLGSPINFTSFNTHCWDNSGSALLASDVVKIDMVALLVASSEYATSVRNLCLTRIDLGK